MRVWGTQLKGRNLTKLFRRLRVSYLVRTSTLLTCESLLILCQAVSWSYAQCVSEYIGSTMHMLHTRVAEHAGRSFRTGALLSSPPHSNIRAHALSCSSPVAIDNFNILAKGNNNIDVRILESLFIYKIKPDLNDSQSAFPLNIVGR